MKVIIKYDDPRDLNDSLRDLQNSDFKIEKISNDTLSVTYPDSYDLYQVSQTFGRYGRTNLIVPYYLVTVTNKSDLTHIKNSLNSRAITFKVFPENSYAIIIDNTNLQINYDELYMIIDNISGHFIMMPYKPKEKEDIYIKVKHDFSSIYHSGILSDIEFNVQGRIFKAHKTILIGMSDYFYSLMIKHYPDQNIFQIDDIEPDLFEDLLNLIYGIDVKINGLETLELIKLVQFFGIKGINIDEIVKDVTPNKEVESNLYIRLLSEIYPYSVPNELIQFIQLNIRPDTDISILSPDVQKLLR